MWKDFHDSIPPHLMHVADNVKSTVFGSKADGTVKTYMGGFVRWKRWANANGLCHLPANPFHVAVYMQLLGQEANTPSPITTAVYSIDWVHGLSGYDKVSSHCMVESMLSALQRVLAKPKNKKEPITIEMLQSLAAKYKDKSSISDLRLMAMCLVGFAGFLRFSELCSIRTRDVKFNTTYCSIFIESSKTDQLREGAWVNIARTDRDTCPVTALQRYVSVAGLILDDDLPLFRALGPSKTSRVRQQGISYTRARELVKEAFKDITDVSKISLHSLRSGGASAAANAGIPDRLFKRHGRWTSENAKDGYVKDNLQAMLSVSKSLGL